LAEQARLARNNCGWQPTELSSRAKVQDTIKTAKYALKRMFSWFILPEKTFRVKRATESFARYKQSCSRMRDTKTSFRDG